MESGFQVSLIKLVQTLKMTGQIRKIFFRQQHLAELAENSDNPFLKIEITNAQIQGLIQAQAAAVQQLDQQVVRISQIFYDGVDLFAG